MRVLIIGNGGREHAISWKLRQSPHLKDLFFTPPNAGMANIADNTNLKIDDFEEIKTFCKKNKMDLVVIGPEAPLVAGLSDYLQDEGITVFGPRKMDAQIEGSKTFAKRLMENNSIPTAAYASFNSLDEATQYLQNNNFPQVIKADGLAAGKGVTIVEDFQTGKDLLEETFLKNKYGSAGNTVVIEEYLEGQEVSLLAFTDGVTVLPMVEAQDYKPIYDDDKGPNTGGMGCYSPVPIISEDLYHDMVNKIVEPSVYALSGKGRIYQGVLYTGIILTEQGPKVLEYNARFGDPETQVILPRLKSDLLEIMLATANQELSKTKLEFSNDVCISVVIASGGYPEQYKTGYEISGIDKAEKMGANVFHAGTINNNGKVLTNGGRVLNVTAVADNYENARTVAYEAVSVIDFHDVYYRKDIGLRAIENFSYS